MTAVNRLMLGLLIGSSCFVTGLAVQCLHDEARITHAQQNEDQANGLEDECKQTLNESRVRPEFKEDANGDYRLALFGSARALVCEEKDIRIVQQGDAVNPVVLECRHAR